MKALSRAIKRAGGQAKLAEMIGVTQGRVSQWLAGETMPTKHFPKIEAATGVSARDLLSDELAKLPKDAA